MIQMKLFIIKSGFFYFEEAMIRTEIFEILALFQSKSIDVKSNGLSVSVTYKMPKTILRLKYMIDPQPPLERNYCTWNGRHTRHLK